MCTCLWNVIHFNFVNKFWSCCCFFSPLLLYYCHAGFSIKVHSNLNCMQSININLSSNRASDWHPKQHWSCSKNCHIMLRKQKQKLQIAHKESVFLTRFLTGNIMTKCKQLQLRLISSKWLLDWKGLMNYWPAYSPVTFFSVSS